MRRHLDAQALVCYSLSGFMVVVYVICFVAALSWFNRPFAGFLLYHSPYVGSMSLKDWTGHKAGLKFLERIESIDGRPVLQGRDVVDATSAMAPGTPVRYVVESGGQKREVTVPVALFGARDYFLTFVINLVGSIIVFSLGVIVYVLKPRMATSWVFFFFCLAVGLYMVTSFEILSTYHLVNIHYLALCFMGPTALHFALIFPDRKRVLTRFPALVPLIYAPALLLVVGYQIFASAYKEILFSGALAWMPSYKDLGTMTRVFTLLCEMGLIALVLHSVYRASTIQARRRATMILFGVTVAFLPSTVIMMAFYFLKVDFPWNFLVIFIVFFPASIAYSIVRHNLFDADAIIRRTAGYVVVTGIVIGAYVGVGISLNVLVGQHQLAQSRAFPLLFTLGVILVFNPLRNRVQALVDRVFFRKDYDSGEILEKIGRALTSLLDLGQILMRLTQTFLEDMFVSTTSIMLLDAAGVEYQVYVAGGEGKGEVEKLAFKRDDPLIQIVETRKAELTRYDVLEDPKYGAVSGQCAAGFEALHASLIVPLIFQDKVIGSLNLGEKKSGKSFNREDIDLLRSLANQGAVAIENARLFQENLEKQRLEEELAIARDLQLSMLPASCPEIEGFDIAALSIPAREVGGDFFDFIEMGEGRLGLVIGDVTGKSVSGALVMSATRSIFRVLSEERSTMGEIMTRANRRTMKDIKSGMFVALLYAVLDSRDRAIRLCSAGQTQPVHVRAATGTVQLVETTGDTFPLGIIEDAVYEETTLRLGPGDRVVLYTDGIVEAMSEKQELFGFERLLALTKDSAASSAESLLREIMGKVTQFVGGAAQHDDLTVIVVRVEE